MAIISKPTPEAMILRSARPGSARATVQTNLNTNLEDAAIASVTETPALAGKSPTSQPNGTSLKVRLKRSSPSSSSGDSAKGEKVHADADTSGETSTDANASPSANPLKVILKRKRQDTSTSSTASNDSENVKKSRRSKPSSDSESSNGKSSPTVKDDNMPKEGQQVKEDQEEPRRKSTRSSSRSLNSDKVTTPSQEADIHQQAKAAKVKSSSSKKGVQVKETAVAKKDTAQQVPRMTRSTNASTSTAEPTRAAQSAQRGQKAQGSGSLPLRENSKVNVARAAAASTKAPKNRKPLRTSKTTKATGRRTPDQLAAGESTGSSSSNVTVTADGDHPEAESVVQADSSHSASVVIDVDVDPSSSSTSSSPSALPLISDQQPTPQSDAESDDEVDEEYMALDPFMPSRARLAYGRPAETPLPPWMSRPRPIDYEYRPTAYTRWSSLTAPPEVPLQRHASLSSAPFFPSVPANPIDGMSRADFLAFVARRRPYLFLS